MVAPAGRDPYPEERQLRTEVEQALQVAMKDILSPSEYRDPTRTEAEKCTHFAARDRNLPLTWSWYLAGFKTFVDADSELEERHKTAASAVPPDSGTGDSRREELVRYFKTAEFMPGYDLRAVIFTNKYEFLHDYYRELAPEEYRQLYIHSLEVRKKLDDITTHLTAHSEHQTLDEFHRGLASGVLQESFEQSFRYTISDFHLDLAELDHMQELTGDVVAGTDLLEQVLAKLTTVETVSMKQAKFLDNLHDFFFYYVWRYPALVISMRTATGPHASELRESRGSEVLGFGKRLWAERDLRERQANDLGLLPEVDERIVADTPSAKYWTTVLGESMQER